MPRVLRAAWAQLRERAGAVASGGLALEAAAPSICQATLCIVALNPGHHTAWNWRRRLLQRGLLSAARELALLGLLATYKRGCKSDLLWFHRRWVVRRFVLDQPSPGSEGAAAALFWESEAALCAQCCERCTRNYHCWEYRWWCYSKVRASSAGAAPDDSELEAAAAWIRSHPADYAAMHYLHLLADLVCVPGPARPGAARRSLRDIAQAELAHTTSCLEHLYAGHESVWCHRRWCIAVLSRHGDRGLAESERAFLDGLERLGSSNGAAVAGLINNYRAWLARELPAATT